MATITVDTDDAVEAIKTIRKVQRQAKKDEARKSALRGVALERARAAGFGLLRGAGDDDFTPCYSVYHPDGNTYDVKGFSRLISFDTASRDLLHLRVETENGTGSFEVWSPGRVTHVIESGAGFIVGARLIDSDNKRHWLAFGVAEDITYNVQMSGKLAEMCDSYLERIMLATEARRQSKATA